MQKYVRFANGLRKFVKSRMDPEEAIGLAYCLLKKRIAARQENFLNLADHGIFRYPASPYLKLLNARKIRFADLKAWVSRDGIEAALRQLACEGVYFTVDEFKGKTPVRRNGIRFSCNESMFDNPFLAAMYEVRSGGTRSAGTRIRIDFDYLHQRSLYDAFLLNIHHCLTSPIANWFPIFPGAPGINSSLRFAHIGSPVRRWFSQIAEDQLHGNWERKYWERKLGIGLIFAIHRLYGYPLAPAEFVDLNDASTIAQWVFGMLQENEHCVLYTFASSAVRVSIAAMEAGLNLGGARFFVTGEPLTLHKRKEIEASGASPVPIYGISEAGVIAAGCDQAGRESDHCHLYKDTTAIITHPVTVPHFDLSLDSYLFTSLLYEAPKLLLNVGMGDYGNISDEVCDCAFGRLRFDTKLSGISSYEKLTGEGVTFVHTDFVGLIEKDLPHTFGGRSTDYQLVEMEDARGLTRLQLLVSPGVGEVNEEQLVGRVMECLTRAENTGWAQAGAEMWKQSRMVQILRERPIPTRSGKILPFCLFRSNHAEPAKEYVN